MYNIEVMKATLLVPLHGNNLSSQTTTVVLFGVLSSYFFCLVAEVYLFNKIRII